MSYLDIQIDDDGLVFPVNANGDFNIIDREVDIVADILLSNVGDFKYAPTVGGNARSYLLSNTTQGTVIQRAFEVALRTAGLANPIVDVSNFPEEIRVNNDVVLRSE